MLRREAKTEAEEEAARRREVEAALVEANGVKESLHGQVVELEEEAREAKEASAKAEEEVKAAQAVLREKEVRECE